VFCSGSRVGVVNLLLVVEPLGVIFGCHSTHGTQGGYGIASIAGAVAGDTNVTIGGVLDTCAW
jgi:hypothetical protein